MSGTGLKATFLSRQAKLGVWVTEKAERILKGALALYWGGHTWRHGRAVTQANHPAYTQPNKPPPGAFVRFQWVSCQIPFVETAGPYERLDSPT